jgi:hypothetical protein
MARKIRLSKKDGYLIAFGIIISIFFQSLSETIHHGQVVFGYSDSSIFLGSLVVTISFGILLWLFLRGIEDKDKQPNNLAMAKA